MRKSTKFIVNKRLPNDPRKYNEK